MSLGCPRNLVDSEVLIGILKKARCAVTDDIHKAGIYIVNTCAFIDDAKRESIDTILELAAHKKERTGKGETPALLIVAGCLPQRYGGEIGRTIPEIDAVFGTADFIRIPDFIKKHTDGPRAVISKTPRFLYDHHSRRELITPCHYAYIKIQEGCKNHCSFCVIPSIRGPYRSRQLSSVLAEIKDLRSRHRLREVNLIGQDTTLYGIDRYRHIRIAELVSKAARIMDNGWVRLLYGHPAHVTDELIGVIARERSVCKYMDLPIQHCNDRILKIMNRRVTKKEIVTLIDKIRKRIPGVALRTSVMTGFPGETRREFEELVGFIKEMRFERLGAFTYSREERTRASGLPGQVSEHEKAERYDILLRTQKEIAGLINRGYQNKIVSVLIDEAADDKGLYYGRTGHDAPEVDGGCFVRSKRALTPGMFVEVRVVDTLEYDLVGEVL
ncbi:MAG: 30S ribosomal protein S12 methylthiotransferase RimO [Candidatus Omnitrophica bacterium]|nr:30S ribosomal protein S12 methylthiotransferase RimO [Candidatus Omnitrophota bacterium]